MQAVFVRLEENFLAISLSGKILRNRGVSSSARARSTSTPLKASAPSWPRWPRPSKSPISPEPSGGRRSSLARRALRKNVDNLARSFRVGAPFGRGRMTPVSREPRVVRLRSNASRRSFVAAKPFDRLLSPETARKAAFSSRLDYRSISKGLFPAFSTTRSLFYVFPNTLPLSTGVEAPFGAPRSDVIGDVRRVT